MDNCITKNIIIDKNFIDIICQVFEIKFKYLIKK